MLFFSLSLEEYKAKTSREVFLRIEEADILH